MNGGRGGEAVIDSWALGVSPDGPTSLSSRLESESQGLALRLEVKGDVGG